MVGCAVATCTNSFRKTKGTQLSYHAFPQDPKLQKIWVSKCRRAEKFIAKYAKICGIHFTPDDYEANKQNELLGIPYKKHLKRTAVPSLHLKANKSAKTADPQENTTKSTPETSDSTVETVDSRSARCKAREIRQRALKRLREISPVRTHFDQCVGVNFTDAEHKILSEQLQKTRRELELATEKYKSEKSKLEQLTRNYIQLKCNQKNLRKDVELEVRGKVTDALKPIFTPGQIKILLQGNKRVKWTPEDMEFANELVNKSVGAYKLLRKRGFPLPGRSTLQRWEQQSKVGKETSVSLEQIIIGNSSDDLEQVFTVDCTTLEEVINVTVLNSPNCEDSNLEII